MTADFPEVPSEYQTPATSPGDAQLAAMIRNFYGLDPSVCLRHYYPPCGCESCERWANEE